MRCKSVVISTVLMEDVRIPWALHWRNSATALCGAYGSLLFPELWRRRQEECAARLVEERKLANSGMGLDKNVMGRQLMVNGSERVSPIFVVHGLGFKTRPGTRLRLFRSCNFEKLSARPAIFLSSSKINHNLKKRKDFRRTPHIFRSFLISRRQWTWH